MSDKLTNIRLVLFDLDGTLYFKGKQIEGAAKTINYLRDKGYKLRFLTNTDSLTVNEIHKRIIDHGIEAKPEEVFSPLAAAREFIKQNNNCSVYFLGSDSVQKSVCDLNIDPVKPHYVIIGDFRDKVSYETINNVFRMINNGAELLALNKGKVFFNDSGINIDTGAFVSMFEYASGKTAGTLGKPNKLFFDIVLRSAGVSSEETLIVGDDISVDIEGAKNAGTLGVLVKTGKFDEKTLNSSSTKPDMVIDSVAGLADIL